MLILNWIVWNRTVYLYKMDLTFSNIQWLMCHKAKSNKQTNKQNWILNACYCVNTGYSFFKLRFLPGNRVSVFLAMPTVQTPNSEKATGYWKTLIIIMIIIINAAFFLDNDTHKLLWDFDIHTEPDYKIINNNNNKRENLQNCGLCWLGWPHNKTEKSEKKDKYLDLARELKKL